jgi:hypothetical protein
MVDLCSLIHMSWYDLNPEYEHELPPLNVLGELIFFFHFVYVHVDLQKRWTIDWTCIIMSSTFSERGSLLLCTYICRYDMI